MKNSSNKILIPVIVIALLAAGAAFYGGMQYQKTHAATSTGGSGMGGGRGGFAALQNLTADQRQQLQSASPQQRQQLLKQFGINIMGGRFGGGGPVVGVILSKDNTSITVKMTDGSTKTVYYSNTTTVSKQQSATADDLATGANVRVNGTSNSDGSVTAQSITLQPAQ